MSRPPSNPVPRLPPGAPVVGWPPEPPPPVARGEVRWSGWDLLIAMILGLGLGLIAAVALFAAIGAAGLEVSTSIQVSIASVTIYLGVALAAWGFVIKRRDAKLADAGARWVGIGPLLLAIPFALGLMFATGLILQATDALFGGVPSPQDQVAPGQTHLSVAELLWFSLAGVVAAPIVEEFFFRGLLFTYLRGRRGLATAVIVSSLLFSVLHFIPALMPALFVFGAIQALVVHRFRSIYPAIALHAINNAVLVILVALFLGDSN